MRRNAVETVLGAVVLIVAGLFVYFAYSTAEVRAKPGYEVTASFLNLGGLSKGSDVRISGVKVGTVNSLSLDPETFDAVMRMTVSHDVQLPVDTVASVSSASPLGGKYVRLDPGTSSEVIEPGGAITETRAFRSLEDQVGEIIFLATSKPGAKK
jgi:phospholipid/cholesterol/gamma-HCH transport system substrate-binding protein